MSRAIQALERAALNAHARGRSWATFWPAVAEQVRQAEPWNRRRYGRLVRRLLYLLTGGEEGGYEPVGQGGTMPWELDDKEAACRCGGPQ
jgi:hypothetical protein